MTYEFGNFRITATYKGDKPAKWSNGKNWNNHWISVVNTKTRKRTGFDFWASIMKAQLSSRYDVLNAFMCFVEDAISGDMTFREFYAEFGYDEDSRESEATWKSCKNASKKLHRIYDGDIYDLINSLDDFA